MTKDRKGTVRTHSKSWNPAKCRGWPGLIRRVMHLNLLAGAPHSVAGLQLIYRRFGLYSYIRIQTYKLSSIFSLELAPIRIYLLFE